MEIGQYIDYTILRPDTTREAIKSLCETAIIENFYAVCIPPIYVNEAVRFLRASSVAICSVVGFPLGYVSTAAKLTEAESLICEGVEELDLVINLCNLKNGEWEKVASEIYQFCILCRRFGVVSKIIIEATLLDTDEIIKICNLCNEVNPDFVKTSTGFTGISIVAQKEKVRLMRDTLREGIKIKVSGGVRSREEAFMFIQDYGVSRIGTSGNLSSKK